MPDVSATILDYKVPFVPSEKEYDVVFIHEGERVVIPCRGSVEDLNVTLRTVSRNLFLFSSHHFLVPFIVLYRQEHHLYDEAQFGDFIVL